VNTLKEVTMKYLLERQKSLLVVLVVSLFLIVTQMCSFAAEVQYPEISYEGDELAQVRGWEKKWVGKKIDHTNIDEVKEYMIDSLYDYYKYPDDYGPNTFTIAPYKQFKPPQGHIDWTLKGAGQVTVNEEGFMENYVSGCPFPNPTEGIHLMYNYECRAVWDERRQAMDKMFLHDKRRGSVRSFAADVHILQAMERTTVPPTPELPKNPRKIRMASYVIYITPPELKGLISLDLQYFDRSKEWDSWLWVPAIRRVRRVDTTQRQDHRSGTDFCADDQNGWFGRVARNTYKLIGRQDVLLGRHNTIDDATFVEGCLLWQNLSRERVNTYVVEAVSKDRNYMYSKMVFWYDPETWCLVYADKYDQKGRLWKINDMSQAEYKSKDGQYYFDVCTQLHSDKQRKHSTLAGGGFPDIAGLYGLGHYNPVELNRIGR
jgi:hypothetical protein